MELPDKPYKKSARIAGTLWVISLTRGLSRFMKLSGPDGPTFFSYRVTTSRWAMVTLVLSMATQEAAMRILRRV